MRRLLTTLAVVIGLVACGTAPTAPPAATSTIEPDAPTGTPAPRSTLASSPTHAPTLATPGSTPAPALGAVKLEFLDRDFVPGSVLRSAAGQIVWSGGAVTADEIWRYVPGERTPELVIDLPRGGSTISDVVASAAGYAFVEVNSREYQLGGWRIWFVEGPGKRPVELDRGIAYGAGFPPTLAMDDGRIVWAAFDEPDSGDVSMLRLVATDDLDSVTTIRRTPVRDGLLWLPALNGEELWYAIIHPDQDGTAGGDEFHIERLDLANPGAPAQRFEGTANDFNPVASDEHVAWKTAVGDGAALNWGTITVLERSTGTRTIVPLQNVNRPSLGSRFLTFEEITRRRLAVFDLPSRVLLDLRPDGLDSELFIGGQSVSGSLLTFFTQRPRGLPRIGWVELPD